MQRGQSPLCGTPDKTPQRLLHARAEPTLNLYHKNTRRVQRGQSPLCGTPDKTPQRLLHARAEPTLNLYHKNTGRVQRGQSPLCGTRDKTHFTKTKICFSKTKFYVLVKQINRKTTKEAGARSALASFGAKRL